MTIEDAMPTRPHGLSEGQKCVCPHCTDECSGCQCSDCSCPTCTHGS
jgi:hypothetical protein